MDRIFYTLDVRIEGMPNGHGRIYAQTSPEKLYTRSWQHIGQRWADNTGWPNTHDPEHHQRRQAMVDCWKQIHTLEFTAQPTVLKRQSRQVIIAQLMTADELILKEQSGFLVDWPGNNIGPTLLVPSPRSDNLSDLLAPRQGKPNKAEFLLV